MAINQTTLSGAIGASDAKIGVVSATNITAPVLTTGVGITYLLVENELMYVNNAPVGLYVPVSRGYGGTQAVAHASGCAVIIGTPTDFATFTPAVGTVFTVIDPDRFDGFSAPVASATTITASGPRFHVTGTTPTATINLPTGFVEGQIDIVADGVWTWTAAGNIAVAGTVTTAGSSVRFLYDAGTTKWYPARLA
jgi:hypothetical protein